MKRLDYRSLLTLFVFLLTWSVTPIRAADEKGAQEVFQDMKDLGKINERVKEVGSVKADCLSCIEKKVDKKLDIDKEDLSIGKLAFWSDNTPYTILLKRTASSPEKMNLKVENGHRYCEKPMVGTLGGSLVMGCAFYLHSYEDEELSFNFKNLPKLKEGEEEIIEVKLTKRDINNSKYTIEVKNLSTNTVREEIDKKFFGRGFNIDFEMKSK